MKNKIITIAGYSCSGKSTVIKQLEEIYNCEIIKFGMVHRECANGNGYTYAKDWIKEKGFEPYESELLKYYIQKLKDTSTSDKITIVDGIFSHKCFSFMKECENIDLINIVLNTDHNIRLQRMMQREGLNIEDAKSHLTTADSIKERAGLSKIIAEPTYVVDGNKSVEEIKDKCLLIISQMSAEDRSFTNELSGNFEIIKKNDNYDI